VISARLRKIINAQLAAQLGVVAGNRGHRGKTIQLKRRGPTAAKAIWLLSKLPVAEKCWRLGYARADPVCFRRYIVKPTPTKPTIIIAQVEDSGTAELMLKLATNEPLLSKYAPGGPK
jgi:hypothetical protein